MTDPNGRAGWPAVAIPAAIAVIGLWSVAPLSVPLVGTDPGVLRGAWRLWSWGLLITAGVTVVAQILSRGSLAGLIERAWARLRAVPERWFTFGGATLFAVGALAFTLLVFAGNPRNVDGFAQLFQARIFLAGRVWMPPPPDVAAFGTLHMILGPERWYAQYPPGQSAVLAAGLAAGVWWLLVPLWALGLALVTRRLAAWTGGPGTGRVALVLLCLSPFALAVSGSEMSHLPAAVLGTGAAALATLAGGRREWLAAAGAGLLLGLMTAFRPLDAVAAALPVGIILLAVARARAPALALTAAAGVVGTLPTLWYNAATTGSWATFGYTALWGEGHSLGFHDVPFGIPLTPLRAVGLTGLDLFQLNQYLLDLPFPVLAGLALAFVIGRRHLAARDAVPLAGMAALSGLLFFYWHRDVFYGPRFLFSALPWLIVLAARGVVVVGREARVRRRLAIAPAVVVIGFAVGIVLLAPDRIRAYRDSTPTLDLHPERAARAAGITNAVIVIPDGWGSRLVARMWAAGVPVRRSTRLYAAIDACTLEQTLDAADADAGLRARLDAVLDSLASLRRPGVPADVTEDRALRLRPDAPLHPDCVAEIRHDRRGFLAFAPYLYLNAAGLDGSIVWARDLRDRNAGLRRLYPGRAFYRYAPREPGGPPVLEPLDAGP